MNARNSILGARSLRVRGWLFAIVDKGFSGVARGSKGLHVHHHGVFRTGRIRRVDVADRADRSANPADREPDARRSRP